MNVSNGMLARFTASKATTNIAFRWMAFFLPTLVVAFSATTQQLTTILGIGEMAGLSTIVIGRQLDQNRERAMAVLALGFTAVGLLMSISGSLAAFAVGYVVVMLGVSLCTASGHAYLGRRVRFERRARAIGIFETSWAAALLIGAPVAAVLINGFGWRGPFIVFAIGAVVLAVILWLAEDNAVLLDDAVAANKPVKPKLTMTAWLTVAASAAIAITGLTTVVIVGTWLDGSFGIPIEGIGFIAMLFGVAELLASSGSAAIADRVGPTRASLVALIVVVLGLTVMTQAGSSLVVGVLGLLLFFLGFEFAIVTSFSIVSEAMPSARGRVLAVNNAVGTLFRGFGVAISGILYAAFGIAGPATLSIFSALAALVLLFVISRRPAPASGSLGAGAEDCVVSFWFVGGGS